MEKDNFKIDEKHCCVEEAALKSLFLGPQAENREWVATQIGSLLHSWFEWRRKYKPEDGEAISSQDVRTSEYLKRKQYTESVLRELSARFEKEIPKFSPRYFGHMFSEISLPALFGQILTLLHNPNNISEESSKIGILLEEEAIESLAQMVGFKNGVGHFTSGGTLANFEAVYRAHTRVNLWMSSGLAAGGRSAFAAAAMGWENYSKISKDDCEAALELNPLEGNPFRVATAIQEKTGRVYWGPVLLVPEHKHYSWVKAANVFGLGAEAIWPVQLDQEGRMDVEDLETQILRAEKQDRPILMVVSVLGTTELGMIDPIDKIQNLLNLYQEKNGWYFWHHIDAAYGGFLCSLREDLKKMTESFSKESVAAINAVHGGNSLTIDPHKLGYVPFSSGAFMTSDSKDYFLKAFGGPYVNFTPRRDKGMFTLEGSRSATGAVATWMTAKCIGLDAKGYGQIIARTIRLRKEFEMRLQAEVPWLKLAPSVDANLLGFCFAKEGEPLSSVNQRTLQLFESFNSAGGDFYISKTKLYRKNYAKYFENFVSSWSGREDSGELVLFRLCIMNPFFKTLEMDIDVASLFIAALKERVNLMAEKEAGFN